MDSLLVLCGFLATAADFVRIHSWFCTASFLLLLVLYGFITTLLVLYGFITTLLVLYGFITSLLVLYGFITMLLVLCSFPSCIQLLCLYGFNNLMSQQCTDSRFLWLSSGISWFCMASFLRIPSQTETDLIRTHT